MASEGSRLSPCPGLNHPDSESGLTLVSYNGLRETLSLVPLRLVPLRICG
jgi:hypothetical protein